MRVLIAEDQDVIRRGLKKIVSEVEGVDVEEASDGAEAWEAFCRSPSDMLITDIVMPDMDGLELIRRVSAYSSDCACVVISGYDKFDYAQRAMAHGVRDYLLKPVRRETLRETILRGKADFESRETHLKRMFAAAWTAAMRGDIERMRDELSDMRAKAAGRLIVVRSAMPACPLTEETGYELCRRVAEIGADTALYISFAENAPTDENGLTMREARFEAGEELSESLLRLAEKWGRSDEAQEDYAGAIRYALIYINRHFAGPISLQEVAEKVYLHPNYFSGLFAKTMGCGFSHYLQQIRIEKSKAMLRSTNMKVHEIAAATGFQNERYFNKVFKNAAGITPQQYRLMR